MKFEIKISNKPVEYHKAIKFLENRLIALKNKKKSELIWILEHPSTYTAGITSKKNEILDKNIKIIYTNRGGKITWHGPGQKICYFVIDIAKRGKDIREFIRLIENSIINTLKEYKIEIHIRSIFLQGLILENSSNWPKSVSKDFKNHHKNLEIKLKDNNLRLIDAAVEFIKNIENSDLILFGITSKKELNLFISKWKDNNKINFFDNNIRWNWNSINDIDPRKW